MRIEDEVTLAGITRQRSRQGGVVVLTHLDRHVSVRLAVPELDVRSNVLDGNPSSCERQRVPLRPPTAGAVHLAQTCGEAANRARHQLDLLRGRLAMSISQQSPPTDNVSMSPTNGKESTVRARPARDWRAREPPSLSSRRAIEAGRSRRRCRPQTGASAIDFALVHDGYPCPLTRCRRRGCGAVEDRGYSRIRLITLNTSRRPWGSSAAAGSSRSRRSGS